MKIKISLKNVFSESEQTLENKESDLITPKINTNRIKQLTIDKIHQTNKKKFIWFRNAYTKIACAFIAVILVTSGSVYAFSNENFRNFISVLINVQQTQVLTVGESVSNNDYELKVHEIVSDSYVGYVVVSIEALSDKSRKEFDNYNIDLQHIGTSFALGELEEYREPYVKYYEVMFSGVINKNSNNDGKLKFSHNGIKKFIEIQLTRTVEQVDMNIKEDNSNGNRYKFNKIHLSEIGLTLEGSDTGNVKCEYWYTIEFLLSDGKKELVRKKMNENDVETHSNSKELNSTANFESNNDGSISITRNTSATSDKTIWDTEMNGTFVSGISSGSSGDDDDYVYVSIDFYKSFPLDTIKQVIINDVAYDIIRN